MLNVLFPVITSFYVSRILLAYGVGLVSDANNNVSYFVILASLGISAYGIREIAKSSSNKEKTDKLFSELFIINSLLTIISLLAFAGFLFFVPAFRSNFWLYFIFGLLIILNVLNVDWLYQGLQQYKFIAIRSSIVKLISLVLLFVFVKKQSDIYIYALITIFATTGNYFLNIVFVRKYIRFSFKNVDLKAHIKPLLFLALCTISTELYARVDMTMLGAMCNKEMVAYYNYAHTAVNMVVVLNTALTAVILPRLSIYAESDKAEFDRLLKKGLNSIILISIPSFVGLIAVAEPLVLCWLGDDFAKTSSALMVLAFMIPLKSIGDIVCYQVMISFKKEKILMIAYFLTLSVNFVCNMILIPRLNVVGACIASIASEIVVFVLVLFFSKQYIAPKALDIKNLLITTLGSAIFYGAIFAFNYFIANKWVCLFVDVTIGIVIFLIVNILFKNKVFLSLVDTLVKRKYKAE